MIGDDIVQHELHNVRDDQHRTERVQVDVEAVRPLDVLAQMLILNEILIAQIPKERGEHEAHSDTVDEHKVEKKLDERPYAELKVKREHQRRETQPAREKNEKRGIVACKLTFRFFTIVEIFVHFLRRREQVHHLPQRKLKVHLIELEQTAQVAVTFHRGRHARFVRNGRRKKRARRVFAKWRTVQRSA